MKHLFGTWLLAIAIFTLTACGHTSHLVSTPLTQNFDQVADRYFSASLSGGSLPALPDKKLSLNDVDKVRSEVWTNWMRANDAFEEEKLPVLNTLMEPVPGNWHLPEALEPHAVMPFYWGTKGVVEYGVKYPMFLYLHGSGPKAVEWNNGLVLGKRFKDAPSVYFIPQIPNEGEYYRWYQRSKQFAWEKLLRLALKSGHIDANRLYVFGISEGGYGSQRLASFYGDYWAGAGPMAGGEPLMNAPVSNCANLAFRMRTGEFDTMFGRNVLTRYTNEAFDSLQRLHPGYFDHLVDIVPGAGHGVDYFPTTPWLREKERNPYPKDIWWENFPMDGRYRNGFYNIEVLERSNADDSQRGVYELHIADNKVELSVKLVKYAVAEAEPRWGIPLRFNRTFTPADRGKVRIYLNEHLVDMKRAVTVMVNGKQVFKGKLTPTWGDLVRSCALFYDPARIYPASVTVDLQS